jgi:hypothetical protein
MKTAWMPPRSFKHVGTFFFFPQQHCVFMTRRQKPECGKEKKKIELNDDTLFFFYRRGYWTRNLDTRLGLEQLRFRNVKVQKAFTRVSMKLQYLQGRILQLEENGVQMHEVQEEIHKDLEDMADQMDALRQDLDQGLKQLDEQVSEEKEQTTLEIRGLMERIQKMEEELKTLKTSNAR